MQIKRLSETVTEIDGAIRVERGPVRRSEVATTELLSDEVTAGHYRVGGVDALGKTIALGKTMDFIDWKGGGGAFYVYQRDAAGRFQPVGTHETEDAAMSQAASLAAEAAMTKGD